MEEREVVEEKRDKKQDHTIFSCNQISFESRIFLMVQKFNIR